MHLLHHSLLSLSAMLACAAAVPQPPSTLNHRDDTTIARSSHCPSGPYIVRISADRATASLELDTNTLTAKIGPGVPSSQNGWACQFDITVPHARGRYFTVDGAVYYMALDLHDGNRLNVTTKYTFLTHGGEVYTSVGGSGRINGAFNLRDTRPREIARPVWSQCGPNVTSAVLRVATTLTLAGVNEGVVAEASLLTHSIGLRWDSYAANEC
ncbi:hypothetical protein QBC34DRAFT_66420 [Podospora aff. communis PSN243]|uniref:Ubiquitin 3 binding protein But2 C-terminal domain-containing protein n=1 Tax=Podospora aff. communis PSN243 TaxID=3040156 RepID=A0AAV9H6A1_9PEZI|nr:hypothetical protein QBC34DRAFT_66420 [Podospora aff. communis PSN243]